MHGSAVLSLPMGVQVVDYCWWSEIATLPECVYIVYVYVKGCQQYSLPNVLQQGVSPSLTYMYKCNVFVLVP